MADTILTVSQLNTYLKSVIDGLPPLRNVLLRGEVSNFVRYYKTGHIYMTLKDDKSAIKVVLFKRYADSISFPIENGMGLVVVGQATVYEKDGNCQIIAYDAMPDGVGAENLRLKQLLEKLKTEGLFEESRKRPLPRFPSVIGVVTSKAGAALSDIKNTVKTRYPLAKLLVAPVLVQGEKAPFEIKAAITRFGARPEVDVLIISRGGGASEDLSAFNDEDVVRAAAACPVPVIAAVGHEIDTTLLDLAADARASTPTFGAMLATPDSAELTARIQALKDRMLRAEEGILQDAAARLKYLKRHPGLLSADYTIGRSRQVLDGLKNTLLGAMGKRCDEAARKLSDVASRLDAMSPLKVLSRGYAIVFDEAGVLIPSVKGLKPNDTVTLRFTDGAATAAVASIHEEEEK